MRSFTLTPFLFAASIAAIPIMDTVLDQVITTAVVHEVVTVQEGANQPTTTQVPSVAVKVDAVQNQAPVATVTSVSPAAAGTSVSVSPVAAATSAPSTNGLPLTYQPNLDSESDTYQGLVLLNHNIHRANHSVPDLVYNSTLSSYAEQIAKTCVYAHSKAAGDGNYGQNIGAGIVAGNVSTLITNMLYNGEIDNYPTPYGQESPDNSTFESWGHYSQMVWSDTTSVGCYTYDCSPTGQTATQDCNANGKSYLENTSCGPDGGTPAVFTVCNYYPSGNVAGEYDAVKAPLGHGIVQMTDEGLTGPGV